MKVNITMDDELMAKLEEAADEMYTTRSGFITMCVSQVLASRDAINAVKDMAIAIKKIADTGEIDDSTRHQIEDFQRIAKMIIPVK
jgi:metal-responsive CopG/Arc/MetJ family transcriptional regulator